MTAEPPVNGNAIEQDTLKLWALEIMRRASREYKGKKKVNQYELEQAIKILGIKKSEVDKEELETDEFPMYCSLTQLPDLYKARWPEHQINIYKATVQHWRVGARPPFPGPPLHPGPNSMSRYVVRDCFDWFEKHVLPLCRKTADILANSSDTVVLDEQAQVEKEEREHARFLRQRDQGLFIERVKAVSTGIAAIKQIHLMCRNEDERNLPKMVCEKLMSLNVPQETIESVRIWLTEHQKGVTDRRELEMENFKFEIPKEKE